MLTEREQKGHIFMILLYKMPRIGKSPETESRIVVLGTGVRREWEMTVNGYTVSTSGDENALEPWLVCSEGFIRKTKRSRSNAQREHTPRL